jgi:hypothetical protein
MRIPYYAFGADPRDGKWFYWTAYGEYPSLAEAVAAAVRMSADEGGVTGAEDEPLESLWIGAAGYEPIKVSEWQKIEHKAEMLELVETL